MVFTIPTGMGQNFIVWHGLIPLYICLSKKGTSIIATVKPMRVTQLSWRVINV